MNSQKPAYPVHGGYENDDPRNKIIGGGLTKREYFAAMALTSLAVQWGHGHQVHACEIAISYADELLKQLES